MSALDLVTRRQGKTTLKLPLGNDLKYTLIVRGIRHIFTISEYHTAEQMSSSAFRDTKLFTRNSHMYFTMTCTDKRSDG